MISLTIRLDEETDSLLNSLAERLQESKSSLARQGIMTYLQQQQKKEIQKQALEQSFSVSSIDEVQKRVAESEASYQLSDEEYEQVMNEFFARELGLVR
ncbi:ribbon-helix-helix domain-containing protein [Thiomicrospira cyclica]|uniref:CopG-like domain-containing protein DNA-binding protein n=1 Tax=Thiomicrospira cyclica (strain DSM 14477 / JCM 11371 / ALM1) TaxID=717773 RepID=F6DCN3_THICA|nr:ribbon-helix-helix protein, CopG family [Thiomicrospira cyclica]AEG31619.1 CopG-like domain-containing protein DNA-binding protein [Thiomicrospira cyclica ALM1]